MGLVLLVFGLVVFLYSPWAQQRLSQAAVKALNNKGAGTEYALASVRIRPPLDVEVRGFSAVTRATGDTTMAVGQLVASARLLPLLKGQVELHGASLSRGRYVIGTPDSALWLRVNVGEAQIRPATVSLGTDMAIVLSEAKVRGGGVAIDIRDDVPSAPVDTAKAPSGLSITARRLEMEDFRYTMRLMPVIDSLGAHIGHGVMTDGAINLLGQTVRMRGFRADSLRAAYIAPDSLQVAQWPLVAQAPSPYSEPWTVTIDTISVSRSQGLYSTHGYQPLSGFDPAYIQVDGLSMMITDFLNRATVVKLPFREIAGKERCGLQLTAKGILDIDSAALKFTQWNIATDNATNLALSGLLGMGDMTADPAVPVSLEGGGKVAAADLSLMFPAMDAVLKALPPLWDIMADVGGTIGDLDIGQLDLNLGRTVALKSHGNLQGVMDPDLSRMGGDLWLDGTIANVANLRDALLDPALAKMLNIPPLAVEGHVALRPGGDIDGTVTAITEQGSLALDGQWRGRPEAYDVDLHLRDFPVNAFMPTLGVGRVTAALRATGHGLDVMSTATAAEADFSVDGASYGGHQYKDITGHVQLADGVGELRLTSASPDLDVDLTLHGTLVPQPYQAALILDARCVDLQALGMSATPMTIGADLAAEGRMDVKARTIQASVDLRALDMDNHGAKVSITDVKGRLMATDSTTTVNVDNRDLMASFGAEASLESLMGRFAACADTLAGQLAARHVDIAAIRGTLPPLRLQVDAGDDNMLADLMAPSKTTFQRLRLDAVNDSAAFDATGTLLGLRSGTMAIDTAKMHVYTLADSLLYRITTDNAPGQMDAFAHMVLRGYVSPDRAVAMFTQQNAQGRTGFDVGAILRYMGSTVAVQLVPEHPIIGYKDWTVNPDNFISLDLAHRHIDADLKMQTSGSSLELFTDHPEEDMEHAMVHQHGDTVPQEPITLRIHNLHLADWMRINPLAPSIEGNLSADMRVSWGHGALNGNGTVTLDSLYYDRQRVGNFMADMDITTARGGLMRAKGFLDVDGHRRVAVEGCINDSTSVNPFSLTMDMTDFPLDVANAFLGPEIGSLRGNLRGRLAITGRPEAPRFDGFLQFDSAAVRLALTGQEYAFAPDSIDMTRNVITLDRFRIWGVNGQPLVLEGTLDMASLTNAGININASGQNVGLVDTRRAVRGADVYGKAFIDLDASVKGDMRFLNVNASATVLPETNVTYLMPDAATALQTQNVEGMVKFVQFADSGLVAAKDSIDVSSMLMNIDALLTIDAGSTINVDLNSNGSDRVSLQANGTVNYTQQPLQTDGRLTGRINVTGGYARYTLPVMGEKRFDFDPQSYVAFNGDMLNPTLNVHATDVIRANVTQEGQNSRLVDFDVSLAVTGTLNTMNVVFDLATDDDITIANELQSMSPQQRANQAMNMLLYGIYSGPGTKGNGNLSGNLLNSFLASTINNWAAQNIRGVDLSFGIDQYDQTTDGATSTATQYSYRVSKSLFNNRVKIVVGGSYNTESTSNENLSQNLVNDISVEYRLNRSGTMYVRLFRHTGYESILEGEITQTGVGFVYRRRIASLWDMFKPFRHNKPKTTPPTTSSQK